MSLQEKIRATCTNCGGETYGKRWLMLATTDHSTVREDVLNGRIRLVECSICNGAFDMDGQFLYHDTKRKFMVFYYPSSDSEASPLVNSALESMATGLSEYRMRMVTSWNQLREKIRIFEADLDDMTVETIKVVVGTGAFQSVDFGDDAVFFSEIKSKLPAGKELVFQIFQDGVCRTSFPIPHEAYESASAAWDIPLGEWKSVNQSLLHEGEEP